MCFALQGGRLYESLAVGKFMKVYLILTGFLIYFFYQLLDYAIFHMDI